jgi:hypothetical protein
LKDDRSKPLGTHFIEAIRVYPIPDADAKKQYGETNVFEVHFDTQEKKKKVIVLAAPSEEERRSWCKTVQSAKAQSDTRRKSMLNTGI